MVPKSGTPRLPIAVMNVFCLAIATRPETLLWKSPAARARNTKSAGTGTQRSLGGY
jgi:hypothetical protein